MAVAVFLDYTHWISTGELGGLDGFGVCALGLELELGVDNSRSCVASWGLILTVFRMTENKTGLNEFKIHV